MRCEDVQDLIESLADGELQPTAEMTAHLQACANCSTALTRARQIDSALPTLPKASPPSAFTQSVLLRTRSIRWQSEQRFDWWFNAVVAASLAVVALGVYGLMNLTGLAAVVLGTAEFVVQSVPSAYRGLQPQLRPYLTAMGLVLGALALWWWVQRASRPRRTV